MKKLISVMLALLMVISIMPTYAVVSFAEESNFAGPNDSDHAYLDIHSNGEDYSFYFMGGIGEAKIDGVCYDFAANTLTLNNYNEPGAIIEACEMGSDFTISVTGENHIKAITVRADKYMGSLTIVGDGSIYINENKDYNDVPLYLDANNTGSVLEIEDSVKLSVCANADIDNIAVKVLNSLNENPIVCADTEYRISGFDTSYTSKKWVTASNTQMNTFFRVKDSDKYATFCYDEYSESSVYYEFSLVNKNIDGENVVFAKQTADEMGNPIIIPDDAVSPGETVSACQIMKPFERAVAEKSNDETEYTLTEYTLNNEGPFWEIYKVMHDEELGMFFYPVALDLTEEPTEYNYVFETVGERYKYIEYDFANFENTEPVEDGIYFRANVRDSAITYHDEDNIYIEEGKTALISFDLFDDEDVRYVPAWYSFDMAEQGFEIAPEPVVIDDVYYASITNNAEIGNSGTLIINAFSAEKFADPDFDFTATEPDATFNLCIISVGKYAGVAMIEGKEYPENSTIIMHPDETIKMYYFVPNFSGFCINAINPDPLTEAGFNYELCFDEEEMPYAVISSKDVEIGTSVIVPLSIKRFEDCAINDFNFEITPSIYEYSVKIEVAGENEDTQCNHHYISSVGAYPQCEIEGSMDYECEFCHDSYYEVIPANGHKAVKDTAVAPTCKKTGKTEGSHCSVCNKVIKAQKTVPATGHKEAVLKAVTATAKKSGLTEGKKCSVCGKVLVAQKITLAQVTGLKTSTVSKTSIKLTWTKIAGAKYYKVEQSTDGKTWKAVKTIDTNSITVSKLTAGKKYKFRVTALDVTKKIAGKVSTALKTGTLTSATTVTLKSSKSKTATASWKKVAGATSYIVYKSTDSKKWTKVTATTALTCTITKLTGGKKIYVKVTAVNAYSKESAASAVKNVTVKK